MGKFGLLLTLCSFTLLLISFHSFPLHKDKQHFFPLLSNPSHSLSHFDINNFIFFPLLTLSHFISFILTLSYFCKKKKPFLITLFHHSHSRPFLLISYMLCPYEKTCPIVLSVPYATSLFLENLVLVHTSYYKHTFETCASCLACR